MQPEKSRVSRVSRRKTPIYDDRKTAYSYRTDYARKQSNFDDDFDDDAFNFDDDIEITTDSHQERIEEKLDIIIEKLAKLEEILSNTSTPVKAGTIQPQLNGFFQPAPMSSVLQGGGSSMIQEMREALGAQQTNVMPGSGLGQMSQGTMNMTPQVNGGMPQIPADNVSTITTLPANTYDDDVPNIINL